MPGLTVIPKYPIELLRFIRAPAAYIGAARTPGATDVYEPLAAFGIGLAINISFATYEARRWQGTLDKETEQLYLILVAILNFFIVHGICRRIGGTGSIKDTLATFEYLYGFLLPPLFAAMSLLMAITNLFPGMTCRLALDTFDCSFLPTTFNVLLVSSVQVAFIVMAIYVLVVFNRVIVRIHKLGTGRVVFAQAVGLGLLFVLGHVLYGFAHWVASTFKDFFGALSG